MHWQRLIPTWAQRLLGATPPPIAQALWQRATAPYPFLQQLSTAERTQLQALAAYFLQSKEFSGAHGLTVTDEMALGIAAQACVLLLHWGPPAQAIRWFDDFVGIVVHPEDAVAHREWMDDAGVVHTGDETLLGEAMEGGPVMLSWAAVQPGHPSLGAGANVVIHEFAHKLDLRGGDADGCPPLPAGFMGHRSARAALQAWNAIWQAAYADFREQVICHERFDQPAPWLDAYGAENRAEFFAVACEAYWVDRPQLARALPTITAALDAFFQRPVPPRA